MSSQAGPIAEPTPTMLNAWQSAQEDPTPTSLELAARYRTPAETPLIGKARLGVTGLATTAVLLAGAAQSTAVANPALQRSDASRCGYPTQWTSTPAITRTTAERRGIRESRRESKNQHVDPLIAVKELGTWLLLSDAEVSQVAGFARRNISNWQNGKGSYGGVTRRLMNIHALVGQLVAINGTDRARLWLAAPLQQEMKDRPNSRMSALSLGEAGISAVLQDAEQMLFPHQRELLVEPSQLVNFNTEENAAVGDSSPAPGKFNRPPRRGTARRRI